MNERIKLLVEQADIKFDKDISEIDVCVLLPSDLDKFAELIVKECLKISKEQLAVIPKNQKDWDGHNYGFTAAVYGFEELVKEHFGVE